jgi:hypothetical protein
MPTKEEQSNIFTLIHLIYRLQRQYQIHDILFDLILENTPTEEELEQKSNHFNLSVHLQKLKENPEYRQEQEEKKQTKINLMTDQLEELEKNGYVTLKRTTQFLGGPPPSINSVLLTTEGMIIIDEDPNGI